MAEVYRVVIVEDDHDVAEYTRAVLEKRGGCDVKVTADPYEAVALVEQFNPDVVVTDIEMPGMTGLTLMEQIRAAQPYVPIVVMTAHVSVDYAVAALRAQADEFLTKPVNAKELVSVVTRVAATGRANRIAARPRENVLAIGAHPGDVEYGVGGLISSHRSAGDRVTILVIEEQRNSGDSAAALIERTVAEINPTMVYTHSRQDQNQEHREIHDATRAAAASGATIACYQSCSSTVDFRPSRFLSIDGFTQAKLSLLESYRSHEELRDQLDPDLVLASARYWGRFGGGTSVEPLEIVEERQSS